MPYLIKNECVTLAEARESFNLSPDSENIIQLIDIISRKGVSAFHGFLRSLAEYTADEPGERGLIELLSQLKEEVEKRIPKPEPTIAILPTAPDAPTTESTCASR